MREGLTGVASCYNKLNPPATCGKTPLNLQRLSTGRVHIDYGAPVEYQSDLMVGENSPSLVTYKCAKTMRFVGKVYKTGDGRWYLATCHLQHWMPVEVFSKIEGFLFLNALHKQAHQ